MKKNIFKKFIVLFSLSFVLFGYNFVFAADVNLTIKDGNISVFSGKVTLQQAGMISLKDVNGDPYPNLMDSNGHPYLVDANSVLSVLNDADILSNDFAISDLQYSGSLQSFYLKCITGTVTGKKCDNWQYWVEHTAPRVGMDKTTLTGGENIYLYYNFGAQHKVLLSSSTITTSDSLTVTAKDYDYENSTWIAGTRVTIGLTQPDPNGSWTPIEVQTGEVDVNGQVIFSSLPVGSYDVGIKEDYYWPTEKLIVTKAIHESHGSSGSYVQNFVMPVVVEKVFNLENALKFLEINQKSDGSYSAPMYTDWVAVAARAGDDKEIESKLINYLKENGVDSSVVTDNERRAMALMSLGINPYSGTSVNYIKKITDSFDGTQFGNKTLVNDDIFALIVLKNAGYSINDELITKDLNYIISQQDESGSWGSIDMTAAGVQALKSFENIAGVNDAILRAEKYITTNQKTDGGFENSSSTSWVLQTLFADKEILKAEGYLASKQDKDGGMESVGTDLNTRIWETAYAIPAILHKPWNTIINNFPKPDISTLTLNKNEVIKQNRKVTSKISNINNGEIIKNGEDRRKIENIVDSNGEVKVKKPSNIWHVISAPFSWLLGKLGF
jgi:hypothetical protein